MDKLPPEIWRTIFRMLNDSRDFENAYNSSPIWQTFLEPTKPCWLFGQAFPELLQYLSRQDMFRCRAICRLWCYGVDNFLENNASHRPAFEERPDGKHWKTDHPPYTLQRILQRNSLIDLNISTMPQTIFDSMISSAPTQSRYPIIGRSVSITEEPIFDRQLRNREFLKAYGKHVWFLRIVFSSQGQVIVLRRILDLIPLVPNLKKLRIHGNLTSTEESFADYLKAVEAEEAASHQMGNPKRQRFNLESLQLGLHSHTISDRVDMTTYLFRRFNSDNLQSLEIAPANNILNYEAKNIVDLSVNLDSDLNKFELFQFKSPVRKLTISLTGNVHCSLLFQVVKGFWETLRNLVLYTRRGFYVGKDDRGPFTGFEYFVETFTNREILKNVPLLKRVTLKGSGPLSLNFLMGLNQIREYLHIFMDDFELLEYCLSRVVSKLDFTEEIDLLECMRRCKSSETTSSIRRETVYNSNVWQVFPKLKILTISWNSAYMNKGSEVQYRRDVYEKLKCN